MAFQIAPPRSRIIDTRYTGRFPQTRPTAEPNSPATPAGQNCHPENVATTAYVVWNSFTRTALMGAMAGPSTAAIPRSARSTEEYIQSTKYSQTAAERHRMNSVRSRFHSGQFYHKLATTFLPR